MKQSKPTLAELRKQIREERRYVGLKPYSHNLISLALQMIAKQFGRDMANKAIKDLGLEAYGWRQEDGTRI